MPTWEYTNLFVELDKEGTYYYWWRDNRDRHYKQPLREILTELGQERWELVDLAPQEWENEFSPTGAVRLSRVRKYMALLKRQTGP